MAATNDPNITAEILSRINSDMEKFSYITEDTTRAMKDAETGVKNFAKKADQAADLTVKAFTSVASSGIEAATAMHEGAKGNQAFNSSLDKMKEGVEATGALLTALIPGGPLVKAFVAALTLAAGKAIDMQKVYGKMSDDLFKGFQDISKSGAAASDGMTGLQAGMRKLGLGVQDMDSYVKLISASSKDLALFKGSVFEGRKAFENIGQGMQQYNYQLRAAGLTQEEINAGTMGYLKLQTRVGLSQTQTTQQLAEGAKKYLIEQDALTKLTGMSREEAEKTREAARSQQMFRAQLEDMRNSGDANQIAAADRLEATYVMLAKRSATAAKGFGDMTTGMVYTEEAQKLGMSTNYKALEVAQAMVKGQMGTIQGFQIIAGETGRVTKQMNALYKTGVGEETFLKISEGAELGLEANRNLQGEYEKIIEDQKNAGIKGGKAQDDLTDANIRLAKVQQEEMLKLQAITAEGMQGAVDNNIKLATAAGQLAPIYDQLTIAMIKFQAMMGQVVDYILPEFIKGMNFLLDKLGLAMASDLEKQEKGFYGDAGAAGGAAIGMYAPGFWKALAVPLGAGIGKVVGDIYGTVKSGNFRDTEEMFGDMQGMAVGGPVKANSPYIVGEKGPELFVPKSAGNIVNNNDLQQNVSMPNMPDMSNEYKKIESGILSASKNSQMLADLTPEYKKIDLATKDIVADIQRMAKYDDLRATNTKTFTEKYTDYTKSMSDLLDQDLVNTTRFMEAGGTSAVSSAMSGGPGGGQGIKPTGSGAPGMTGADSLQGLKMKKGDVQAEGAGVHPKLVEMAKQVQSNMPNFAYFSAFNDQYHQENAPSSFHTKGLAMDFALSKAPTKEEGQAIVKYLQSIGASTAIDEYNNPSSKSTAGHIHAQIPGFADGGIAMEPTIAMVAEKAPEVMMPLTNDGFLGQLNTSINSLLPQQQRMVSLLEDMGRSMQATATASERMAAVASN